MRALFAMLLIVLTTVSTVVFAQNPAPVKAQPFALSEDYPYEDVEVMMPDTVLVHGRLYDPSQLVTAPPASGNDDDAEDIVDEPDPESVTKYPLVILVHGLNGTNQDWGNLPETLVKKGYAVLSMDLRGHGESDRNIKGGKISWRTFKGKQWEELPRDIERVVRYLKQEQEFPQVDTSRVALVGAKMGGNVTIIAASRMKAEVKSLVILSAGINYKGLDTSRAIVSYVNPIFVVASQQDVYSYESSELLYRWATGVKKLQLYRQIGDGTEMLRHLPTLKTEIAGWLGTNFPPTPLLPRPKPLPVKVPKG